MRTTKRILGPLAVIAAMLALAGTGWSQCAMCRTALENSVEGQQIAEGFRHGVHLSPRCALCHPRQYYLRRRAGVQETSVRVRR